MTKRNNNSLNRHHNKPENEELPEKPLIDVSSQESLRFRINQYIIWDFVLKTLFFEKS